MGEELLMLHNALKDSHIVIVTIHHNFQWVTKQQNVFW